MLADRVVQGLADLMLAAWPTCRQQVAGKLTILEGMLQVNIRLALL